MDLLTETENNPATYLTADGNWLRLFAAPSTKARSCLFLDRDGVIIEDRHYLADPAGVSLIEGIAALILEARHRGMLVVVVTNQSGIARGYYDWAAHARVEARMLDLLAEQGVAPDAILACGHHPAGSVSPYNREHDWRKPRAGMLLTAAQRLNINLTTSVMVGDKLTDIQAARMAGLPHAIYVRGEDCATDQEAMSLANPHFQVQTCARIAEIHPSWIAENTEELSSGTENNGIAEEIASLAAAIKQLSARLDEHESQKLQHLLTVFVRQPPTIAGYPSVRPHDCRTITRALKRAFEKWRPYFQKRDALTMAAFWNLAGQLEASVIRQYPTELLALTLVMAQAHAAAGDPLKARALIEPYLRSPYSLEVDPDNLHDLLWLDCCTTLQLGRSDIFNMYLVKRLALVARLSGLRKQLYLFSSFSEYLSIGARVRLQDGLFHYLLWISARTITVINKLREKRPYRRLTRLLKCPFQIIGGISLFNISRMHNDQLSTATAQKTPPSAATGQQVLVTRAMGGIGDFVMMTAGLRILSKQHGFPIKLAIPVEFFPLFENNPHVDLIDIKQPQLDAFSYMHWYNLTACPAVGYESRARPFIKKGRAELFAAGMGIQKKALIHEDMHLDLWLNAEQDAFREQFLKKHGLDQERIIGIQPFSRDSYKDHPLILNYIARLAKDHKLLVFHHLPLDLPHSENIVSTANLRLEQSLALVPACSVLLSVDSAFLHIAAAFDVPAVALFGPTDGQTFTQHHKRVTVLDTRQTFHCVPCWRNEDMSCQVTQQTGYSPCIATIEYERIKTSIDDWLK